MIIHIYTAEERIKEIAYQIDDKSLNEVKTSTEKNLNLNAEVSGGLPNWMGLIGFKGQGKIGGSGEFNMTKEEVRTEIDFYIISIIKSHILKNKFLHINHQIDLNSLDFNTEIVRVQGNFNPEVLGSTGIERIKSFEEAIYIEWSGNFNGLEVRFGTSKDNYQNRTLIYQYLMNNDIDNYFDLFAVTTKTEKGIIHLLPLFFGIELNF